MIGLFTGAWGSVSVWTVNDTLSSPVFLSKCESRLRDERASKDPEDASLAHAVSGNSLHNFVLENLVIYNEIGGYR